MIRLIRIIGFLMVAAGAIVTITWLVKPLRVIWTILLSLPPAIQIGLGAALFGLLILLGSLLWERMEDHGKEKKLSDEDFGLHQQNKEKEK